MKIYLIDNFDSFTYNLVHLLRDCGVGEVIVKRNDVINLEDALDADAIVISPGPGIPKDSGRLVEVLTGLKEKASQGNIPPVIGVCLGMQAIGELFGGTLRNLDQVYHGISTPVEVLEAKDLFADLPGQVEVGRYHSWVVDLPEDSQELVITAQDSQGQTMAIRHASMPFYGVQFHPESVLTPQGKAMLSNFLKTIPLA